MRTVGEGRTEARDGAAIGKHTERLGRGLPDLLLGITGQKAEERPNRAGIAAPPESTGRRFAHVGLRVAEGIDEERFCGRPHPRDRLPVSERRMECEGLPGSVRLPLRLSKHPGRPEPDMARRIPKPRDKGRPCNRTHPGEREHGAVPDLVLPGGKGTEQPGQRPFAAPGQEVGHSRGGRVPLAEGRDQPFHIQSGDGREHLHRTVLELGAPGQEKRDEGVRVGRRELVEGGSGLGADLGVAMAEQGQERGEVPIGGELPDVRPEEVKEADDAPP